MPVFYMQCADGSIIATQFPQYHDDCVRLTRTQGERLYREQCRAALLKCVKPGQTVYTILRHVAASGMSRRISLAVVEDGRIRTLDNLAATVTGYKMSDKGGIVAGGCGMDMGFALVYALGRALWPEGTHEPQGETRDGGYALRHEWL